MYNREPTLLVDVKYSLVGIEENQSEHLFDKETFDSVLTIAIFMRANINQIGGAAILKEHYILHSECFHILFLV